MDIKVKGERIHVETAGATTPWAEPAPTVLFVHGIGADTEIWSDWRTVLSPRFPTVALDLPGHGRSFRPGAAFDWTFDDVAGIIDAAAHAAGAERLVLIGESLGGTACLTAAAGNPKVAAVIACSTAHLGGSLQNVEPWREQIRREGMGAWSETMLDRRFATGQVDAGRRAWFDAAQRASDGETILKLADLLVGQDMTEKLPTIRCPVLLVAPDSSPFIPLEIPIALKRGLPKGELMVIPGARHGIACSHGTMAAQAALAFLGRHGIA